MTIHLKDSLKKKPPKNGKYYTIAIDGRGGSGKTSLLEYVATLLPDFTVINGDDYFEPTPNAVAWGAFNDERFIHDVIKPLRQGQDTIPYRPFDWHKEPPISERTLHIQSGICIERSFSFSFDVDWDLKIWVETPVDEALRRGIERDQMPGDQGLKAWKEVWQPKEQTHIKKVRPLETADIVIDGTKPFDEQIR